MHLHQLKLDNHIINYSLRISTRARRIRLTVQANGQIIITLPYKSRLQNPEHFLKEKTNWILKQIQHFKKFEHRMIRSPHPHDYQKHRTAALAWAENRVTHFNQWYNFTYNQITIRNQKTRWGSCSANRNLNFNYRLIFLPEHLRNYVIVHELCHLTQLNHSKKFWRLVAHTQPNWREIRKEFRNYSILFY